MPILDFMRQNFKEMKSGTVFKFEAKDDPTRNDTYVKINPFSSFEGNALSLIHFYESIFNDWDEFEVLGKMDGEALEIKQAKIMADEYCLPRGVDASRQKELLLLTAKMIRRTEMPWTLTGDESLAARMLASDAILRYVRERYGSITPEEFECIQVGKQISR